MGKNARGALALRVSDIAHAATAAKALDDGEALFGVLREALQLVDLLHTQKAAPTTLEALHQHLIEPLLDRLRALAQRDSVAGQRVKKLGAQVNAQRQTWGTDPRSGSRWRR